MSETIIILNVRQVYLYVINVHVAEQKTASRSSAHVSECAVHGSYNLMRFMPSTRYTFLQLFDLLILFFFFFFFFFSFNSLLLFNFINLLSICICCISCPWSRVLLHPLIAVASVQANDIHLWHHIYIDRNVYLWRTCSTWRHKINAN